MDGQYMTRKRLRGLGQEMQQVNIPYGTLLECRGGIIYWKEKALCSDDCQMQKDYLVQANDINPKARGDLIEKILSLLGPPCMNAKKSEIEQRDARWKKLWDDEYSQRFRRQDFDDYWLWSNVFYDANYMDLSYIYNLIGGKV